MTDSSAEDLIDRLAGIEPGSPLDALRRRRPQARAQAQQSYQALLEPAPPVAGNLSAAERLAVAAFVAGLHRQPEAAAFYGERLAALDRALAIAVQAQAEHGAVAGPWGRFPAGPLSRENRDGPAYAADAEASGALGPRLAAALAHAHLLVLHPRDAKAAHLQVLLQAGWTETDVVVLSQLVAFLAFQVRVVAGLQVLRLAERKDVR